jgi:hypothetical protein
LIHAANLPANCESRDHLLIHGDFRRHALS